MSGLPKRVQRKRTAGWKMPLKPKGVKKRPNEYDHAQGCPYARRRR